MTARTASHRIAGATLIVAPLLLLAGALIHPPHVSPSSWLDAAEAGRTRFYLSHVAFLGAVSTLVPGVLALGEMVRERDAASAARGVTLALLGIVGLAVLTGTDLFLWQLVAEPDSHAVALATVERIGSSPGLLGPTFALAAGTALGFAILARGLHRARALETLPAFAIAVALPLALLGFTLGWPAITASAVSLVALGPLGWKLTHELPSRSGAGLEDLP